MPDEPKELQRWTCYVDDMDDEHVWLMMADETTDRGDEREIGSFPRQLLAHLDPKPGQYVTVRVMSDRTIDIANTVPTEEDLAAGRAELEGLLETLRAIRCETEGRGIIAFADRNAD